MVWYYQESGFCCLGKIRPAQESKFKRIPAGILADGTATRAHRCHAGHVDSDNEKRLQDSVQVGPWRDFHSYFGNI